MEKLHAFPELRIPRESHCGEEKLPVGGKTLYTFDFDLAEKLIATP